jgi:hypothetical protein
MGKLIYEHQEGHDLPDDAVDGMESMLGDDILSTDWDADVEDPPIENWGGQRSADVK